MEESEWLVSQNPEEMLAYLSVGSSVRHQSASDRKLRLWVEACREAVREGGTTWLDLYGPGQPMKSAMVWATSTSEHVGLTFVVRANLLREIVGNPHNPVVHSMGLPGSTRMHRVSGHCIPDFWLTPTVVEMARYAYDARDFTGLPVVADALEEAGCVPAPCPLCKNSGFYRTEQGRLVTCDGLPPESYCILRHLRGNGPHVRGCWAIDLLLGLE